MPTTTEEKLDALQRTITDLAAAGFGVVCCVVRHDLEGGAYVPRIAPAQGQDAARLVEDAFREVKLLLGRAEPPP